MLLAKLNFSTPAAPICVSLGDIFLGLSLYTVNVTDCSQDIGTPSNHPRQRPVNSP